MPAPPPPPPVQLVDLEVAPEMEPELAGLPSDEAKLVCKPVGDAAAFDGTHWPVDEFTIKEAWQLGRGQLDMYGIMEYDPRSGWNWRFGRWIAAAGVGQVGGDDWSFVLAATQLAVYADENWPRGLMVRFAPDLRANALAVRVDKLVPILRKGIEEGDPRLRLRGKQLGAIPPTSGDELELCVIEAK